MSSNSVEIEQLIQQLELPPRYLHFVSTFLDPLKNRLVQLQSTKGKPLLVGINGAQGTGKTTLCQFLQVLLELEGKNVVNLSIDDFYYSRSKREQLAKDLHPLFQTRGVPGTHDTALMEKTLTALLDNKVIEIPRFDKAIDNPIDCADWQLSPDNVDIILLEGWCVGAEADDESCLDWPINALERDEDSEKKWRGYINKQLTEKYTDIFSLLDFLVMLKAPNFDLIYEWRLNQEKQLAKHVQQKTHIMNDQEVFRFVQHYERLTKSMFANLPKKANVVFYLSEKQIVTQASGLDQ